MDASSSRRWKEGGIHSCQPDCTPGSSTYPPVSILLIPNHPMTLLSSSPSDGSSRCEGSKEGAWTHLADEAAAYSCSRPSPRVTAPIIPISVCVCPGPSHPACSQSWSRKSAYTTATAAAQQMFDQKLCGPVLGQLSPYGQTWASNPLPPVPRS